MDHLLCAKLAVLASPTADIFLSICYVPSSSEVWPHLVLKSMPVAQWKDSPYFTDKETDREGK